MSSTSLTPCHCYIRVSKKDQRPEIQRAQMEKYCASRAWAPVFYEERMKGSVNHRPEFLRAVDAALKGGDDLEEARRSDRGDGDRSGVEPRPLLIRSRRHPSRF